METNDKLHQNNLSSRAFSVRFDLVDVIYSSVPLISKLCKFTSLYRMYM